MGLINRMFKSKEKNVEVERVDKFKAKEEVIEMIDYSKEIDMNNEFKITKELKLEDGSIIQKGTCFIIEGFENGEYQVHFEAKEGNKYNNDLGDNYKFSFNTLKNISEVNNTVENINREAVLEHINKYLSLGEKNFIEGEYKDFYKFTDKYIEDMNKYRNHELQENDNIVDPISVEEYIEHEIFSHETEKKEKELEAKLEEDYDYWNEDLYMGRLEENILSTKPVNMLENVLKSSLNNNLNNEYEME